MLLQQRPINYQWLAMAVEYYSNLGYKQVEVPWLVSPEASLMTAPEDGVFEVDDGDLHLVGSAEQGFIEILMYNPSFLETDTPYFSISPCFRLEEPNEIYSFHFMKLELFARVKTSLPISWEMEFLFVAEKLFEKLYGNKITKRLATSASTVDIMVDDLELGSYGTRTVGSETYTYGTGLALPRAQLAIIPKDEW